MYCITFNIVINSLKTISDSMLLYGVVNYLIKCFSKMPNIFIANLIHHVLDDSELLYDEADCPERILGSFVPHRSQY
uniref:Uncharacterized protein n=1 Tax=Kalanchoe fedtschenkoi TaxID=63787 RepID=A0A7N0UE75_KALFE